MAKATMPKAARINMRRLSMTVLGVVRRRDRIVAAVVEGVAAAQAPGGEAGAFDGAMLAQCADGIHGTRGFEAAALAQHRAHGVVVHLDEKDQDSLHRLISSCQCQSRLRRSSGSSRCRAPLRAWTTMSAAGSSERFRRKLSRTARFTRLRLTAP